MKKIVLLFYLVFLSTISFAQSAANELNNILMGLQSMAADYEQIVEDDRGQVVQKTVGKMYLQRPGKFYWTASEPAEQLIVADGKNLWVYDRDLEQVTVSSLSQALANSPAMILMTAKSRLSRDYNVTIKQQRGSVKIFKLEPKSTTSAFNDVELEFKHNNLQAMRLHDQLGQETVLLFTNNKRNIAINKKYFHFTPPRGVDVIGHPL